MPHASRFVPVLIVGLLAAAGGTAAERANFLNALNSIKGSELQAHVDVLADDSFEGREAGKRGGRAAAGYLRNLCKASGLAGAGDDGGFYQVFGDGYRNVLAMIEGSDPQLKNEIVLIGAHFDHVGYGTTSNSRGPRGYIHNGADDNASGTAGLLETIDAILLLPVRPKRSILFAFWDGEEKGLLGSKHWAAKPTIPLKRIVFVINVDMIGRLRDQGLQIYGARSGWGLRRLLSSQNNRAAIRLDFDWNVKSNSDHDSFFRRRIPVLMFHTGLHDDYHRPSDDAHLVNVEGMESVTRLIFAVVVELTERRQVTGFRAKAEHESKRHQQSLERALDKLPPRLGLTCSWSKEEGLRVRNITRYSAARRAGIRTGDRLVEFDGKPVTNSQNFRLQVLHASSPTTILVEREGQAEPITLDIALRGQPMRIGVSWRMDEAEPGTAVVTRVVQGSVAQIAGIQNGDRIYSVGGSNFDTSATLLDRLKTLPGPFDITIEREGRLRQVTLDASPPLP